MDNENNVLNLLAFQLPIKECSRCGEDHEEMLVKQLVNSFVINESMTILGYSWKDISTNTDEPVPNMEEKKPELFKRPMVVNISEDESWRNNYTFWSFCPKNLEPIFIAIKIDYHEEENDKK